MGSLRGAITKIIQDSATFQGLADDRIYPRRAPDSQLPYVTHQFISESDFITLKGTTGLKRTWVQFDIYSDDDGEADQLRELVQTICVAMHGTYKDLSDADVVIKSVLPVEGGRYDEDWEEGEPTEPVHVILELYFVHEKEPVSIA